MGKRSTYVSDKSAGWIEFSVRNVSYTYSVFNRNVHTLTYSMLAYAYLAGLVLCFIACFILLVIAPL